MYLEYEKPWDFLTDNSLGGPFDNFAEQIQKIGTRVCITLLIVAIIIILIKKYKK